MLEAMSGVLRGGEAARRLDLSREHTARLAKAGRLQAIRTPLGLLFDTKDVERLRHERAQLARSVVS